MEVAVERHAVEADATDALADREQDGLLHLEGRGDLGRKQAGRPARAYSSTAAVSSRWMAPLPVQPSTKTTDSAGCRATM